MTPILKRIGFAVCFKEFVVLLKGDIWWFDSYYKITKLFFKKNCRREAVDNLVLYTCVQDGICFFIYEI